MVVEEIMTKDPVVVQATQSVDEVLSALLELDARHLPVMDGHELVGIVSDRDLRSFMLPELSTLDSLADAKERLSQAVSTLMAGDVLSLEPETEVSEAIDLMLEQKIGAVPVVSKEEGSLVGILSYIDVLKAARGLVD